MKNVDRFRMKRLRDSSLPGFDTFTRNQMKHFYLNHHSIIINVRFDHVPMSHDISNLCPTKCMVFVQNSKNTHHTNAFLWKKQKKTKKCNGTVKRNLHLMDMYSSHSVAKQRLKRIRDEPNFTKYQELNLVCQCAMTNHYR